MYFWMKRFTVPLLSVAVICVCALRLPAQRHTIGSWTAPQDWGSSPFTSVEAIHTFLLPTGKVLFWQSWRESIGLWDPVTGQFSAAALPASSNYNPFCTGHTWLPDGRLMIIGGHIDVSDGLNLANIYDPFTNSWANNVPDMPIVPLDAPYGGGRKGRWYPSATTLGNGDILTLSGDMDGAPPNGQSDTHPLPQVYNVETNSWRSLTTAYKELPLYPKTFLAPDGRVVSLSDYGDATYMLDTSGTGSWTYLGNTLDSNLWNYGPSVMYDTGKVAHFGGGWIPTANVSMMDLNQSTPSWTHGAEAMAQPRRQNNATILADGTVLITGGTSVGGDTQFGFNDSSGKISVAELWDPITQEITPMAAASDVYRGYHSTALLLPDGRVLVTGGNHDELNPDGSTISIEQRSAEIYSPPYLFAADGSPAVRPIVSAAPSAAPLGDTIFVQTPDAEDIVRALWIAPSAVTHAQNYGQRANTLDFAVANGGLQITLPGDGNQAPPGYYMLFLVNREGTPSLAHWIRATNDPPLLVDLNGDGRTDAADAGIMFGNWGGSGTGDINLDGVVDAADAGALFARWTGDAVPGTANPVPEPNGIVVLIGLLAGAGLYRQTRSIGLNRPRP